MNNNEKSVGISKLVPRFLGFGDAYDHLEQLKKISRVYEPIIEATKVAAFGLTLDDQADIWFRTLVEDIVIDFDFVIEDFLTNFAWHENK